MRRNGRENDETAKIERGDEQYDESMGHHFAPSTRKIAGVQGKKTYKKVSGHEKCCNTAKDAHTT